MDKKSKIFFVVFFAIVLIAVGVSFYKYFILKDYYIIEKFDLKDIETNFIKRGTKYPVKDIHSKLI